MNTSFEINKETTTTTWLTPPDLLARLGEFDLDPCAAIGQPWKTAKHHFTEVEDGLKQDWGLYDRVFMNPPYGKGMNLWLEKMAKHGNGITLIFNRLETDQVFDWVWPYCDAALIKHGRIQFLDINGNPGKSGSGTGSVFIAYGEENVNCLRTCGIEGQLLIPDQKVIFSNYSKK